jgi:hypothetical protein
VSCSVGFIVGLAMFGAVTYMPLYLQIVKGVTPSTAGLQLTPMMGGMLVTSIASGRIISHIGRYRAFPIAGTAITAFGMFLLSRLDVDTPPSLASVYMLVVGIGIGCVMQVIVLAVQNDAPARNIGVATSTATFFRSMGGSLGVALLGAIFASRLAAGLADLPAAAAARFSGGVNISPEQVHALPPEVRHDFLLAFVDALAPVFLVAAGLTALAFGLSWLLGEKPLRATAYGASSDVEAEAAVVGATVPERMTAPVARS